MGGFDSGILSVTEKGLDALWLRQQVISGNIANIDTPGYKCKSVEFEDLLTRALQQGDVTDSTENIRPKVITRENTQAREDGNNVDIDAENIELVRTQLAYEALARAVSAQYSRIKYAITEGKG